MNHYILEQVDHVFYSVFLLLPQKLERLECKMYNRNTAQHTCRYEYHVPICDCAHGKGQHQRGGGDRFLKEVLFTQPLEQT